MPNLLSDAQVAQYKRENFLAPFPALTEAETRHYRDCLEKRDLVARLKDSSTSTPGAKQHGSACGALSHRCPYRRQAA